MSVSQAITKNDLINVLEEVVNLDGTDLSQQEINNFVEDLYVTGIQAADYVVEQGTSGIWTYRKWSSGISECWGIASWSITGWSSWGSDYYSTYSNTIAYPTNLFIAYPSVNYSIHTSVGDCWGGNDHQGTKDNTHRFYAMRSTAGTNNITGYADIHAIGKWK